jgi:iron-sulfur cluster assembly protein
VLAISPTASAVIADALNSPDVPEGAGLRLAAEEPTERGIAIGIAFVESPLADDEVIPTGTRGEVFVEPQTAELLQDQVLDAEIDADRVTFSLQPQSLNGRRPAGGTFDG